METPDPWISVSTISWRTHLIVIREDPLVSKNDILRLLEPAQKSWSLPAQVPGLFYSQTMQGPITASLTPQLLCSPIWDSRNSPPQVSLSHFRRQDRLLVWDWADRSFWQAQSEHSTKWSNHNKNINTNNGIIINTISISLGHKPKYRHRERWLHLNYFRNWITQQASLKYFSLSNPMLAICSHPSTHQQLTPQLIPLLINSLIHLLFLKCCPYSLYSTASLHSSITTSYRKPSVITPVFNTLWSDPFWHLQVGTVLSEWNLLFYIYAIHYGSH